MFGTTVCILRSVIPGDQMLSLWFAPIRVERPIAIRTTVSCPTSLSYTQSPKQDIRVSLPLYDASANLFFVAGILAKAESSPTFLIDCGADGSNPQIIWPETINRFIAGSMGLIVPVAPSEVVKASLKAITSNSSDIMLSLYQMAGAIARDWPIQDLQLRSVMGFYPPRISSDQAAPVNEELIEHIMEDLIKVAPLIVGCWPASFGHLQDLVHQTMASSPFAHLRMRDLEIKDLYEDDCKILRIYLSIRRALLSGSFPFWTCHLLEDIMSVPVQELIRFCPDLYHLRNRFHY